MNQKGEKTITWTAYALILILLSTLVAASLDVTLSNQGTNVRSKTTGNLLATGNLTVKIFDAATGGTTIHSETFQNAITNGSWNVMLGENTSNPLSLEFGKQYYIDYEINTESVNFTNLTGQTNDRQPFISPLGDVNTTDLADGAVTTAKIRDSTITDTDISDTTNLTLGEKITFTLGEIIDNIVDGFVRITGNLNVTQGITATDNVTANFFIGNGSLLTDVTAQDIYVNESGDTMTGNLGMTLDSSGYNGIAINNVNGSASTGSQIKLQTQSVADRFTVLRMNDGSGTQEIGSALDTVIINNVTSSSLGDIHFGTQGNIDMTLQSGGNVGIGTQTPRAALELTSPGTAGNILALVSDAGKVLNATLVRHDSGTNDFGFDLDSTGNNNELFILNNQEGVEQQVLYFGQSTTKNIFGISRSSDSGATFVPRFVVNQNGNVGIGTASPSQRLTVNASGSAIVSVNGTSGTQFLEVTNQGAGAETLTLGSGSAATTIMFSNTGDLWIGGIANARSSPSASDADLVIDGSTGNIGIGTASPGGTGVAKLEINGTDSSSSGPHIQTLTTADQYPNLQILPWTHDNVALSFDSYWDGSAWASSDAGSNFQIYKLTDKLRFKYNSGTAAGSAITWTDGMVLDTSGQVGIGTQTPRATLELTSPGTAGNILALVNDAGTLLNTTLFTHNSGTNDFGFNLESTGTNNELFILNNQNGGNQQALYFGHSNGAPNIFGISSSSDSGATFTPRFAVNQNGNIGIGTNSPTQKLHVQGNANITGTLYASNVSSNSPLRLQTQGTTRMFINDTTGNIGIGTTNPNSTLHIQGGGITIGQTLQQGIWHQRIPANNITTKIDTTGSVGRFTSITIGTDGLPIISYDETNNALKAAHCSDIQCTSATITTLDSTGFVDRHTSIVIGTDGLPIISYTNASLKAAHCSDIQCTSATITTLDSTTANIGLYTSITIGTDGLPIISYYDSINADLKVAHCSNTQCTSATTTTVDSTGSVGLYTSIIIGTDGLPIISYQRSDTSDLKVAHCSNTQCTASTITSIDTVGTVGGYTSITIGTDGLPIISYYDASNTALKVAHCSNTQCTSSITTTVDSTGTTGLFTSITIGADRLPIISYFESTNDDLLVAHCSSVNCSSSTTVNLYAEGNSGGYSSITIGTDGLPIISHYYLTSADLQATHCGSEYCLQFWTRR